MDNEPTIWLPSEDELGAVAGGKGHGGGGGGGGGGDRRDFDR